MPLFTYRKSIPYVFFFFFLMIRRPPRSTLFPYTTLFRSVLYCYAMILYADPAYTSGIKRIVKRKDLTTRQKVDAMRKIHPDRKSTRLNSSHPSISYAVFCLKKKRKKRTSETRRSPRLHHS